jgi:hypothetical protein
MKTVSSSTNRDDGTCRTCAPLCSELQRPKSVTFCKEPFCRSKTCEHENTRFENAKIVFEHNRSRRFTFACTSAAKYSIAFGTADFECRGGRAVVKTNPITRMSVRDNLFTICSIARYNLYDVYTQFCAPLDYYYYNSIRGYVLVPHKQHAVNERIFRSPLRTNVVTRTEVFVVRRQCFSLLQAHREFEPSRVVRARVNTVVVVFHVYTRYLCTSDAGIVLLFVVRSLRQSGSVER